MIYADPEKESRQLSLRDLTASYSVSSLDKLFAKVSPKPTRSNVNVSGCKVAPSPSDTFENYPLTADLSSSHKDRLSISCSYSLNENVTNQQNVSLSLTKFSGPRFQSSNHRCMRGSRMHHGNKGIPLSWDGVNDDAFSDVRTGFNADYSESNFNSLLNYGTRHSAFADQPYLVGGDTDTLCLSDVLDEPEFGSADDENRILPYARCGSSYLSGVQVDPLLARNTDTSKRLQFSRFQSKNARSDTHKQDCRLLDKETPNIDKKKASSNWGSEISIMGSSMDSPLIASENFLDPNKIRETFLLSENSETNADFRPIILDPNSLFKTELSTTEQARSNGLTNESHGIAPGCEVSRKGTPFEHLENESFPKTSIETRLPCGEKTFLENLNDLERTMHSIASNDFFNNQARTSCSTRAVEQNVKSPPLLENRLQGISSIFRDATGSNELVMEERGTSLCQPLQSYMYSSSVGFDNLTRLLNNRKKCIPIETVPPTDENYPASCYFKGSFSEDNINNDVSDLNETLRKLGVTASDMHSGDRDSFVGHRDQTKLNSELLVLENSNGKHLGLEVQQVPKAPSVYEHNFKSGCSDASKQEPVSPFNKAVSLFVGRLPKQYGKQELQQMFEAFGPVLHCKIIKGCGFVTVPNVDIGARAIASLNLNVVLNPDVGALQVRFASGELERLNLPLSLQPGGESVKVFIGNLANSTSEAELEQLFSMFGEYEELSILRNQKKESKCSGFVIYKTMSSAMRCIETLHRKILVPGAPRPLEVKLAESKRVKKQRIFQEFKYTKYKNDKTNKIF